MDIHFNPNRFVLTPSERQSLETAALIVAVLSRYSPDDEVADAAKVATEALEKVIGSLKVEE